MGIVSQFAAEMVGEWLWGFLFFSLPLLALSPVLGVNPLPSNPSLALWFAISLLLAVVNGLAIEFLFALLMLSLENSIYNINRVRTVALTLLSGSLIPLAFYPYGIGNVLAWSPFAQTASAPLLIYTGRGDPVFLIGLQMSWAVVLWIAFALYWQGQRERLASQGG
jgi:ABC-2 type transport system permease protein